MSVKAVCDELISLYPNDKFIINGTIRCQFKDTNKDLLFSDWTKDDSSPSSSSKASVIANGETAEIILQNNPDLKACPKSAMIFFKRNDQIYRSVSIVDVMSELDN